MTRILLLALCWLLPLPGPLSGPAWAADFTAEERALIASFGPWPPPSQADPSNRASGQPAAIAFGQALFFDKRLGGEGKQSCADCHQPAKAWSDGKAGAGALLRNTPSLLDVRWNRWFGWDGAQDTLWAQSLRPLLDPAEMNSSLAAIAALLRQDAELACRYRQSFGREPEADDESVAVNAAKALAAFQETLVSGQTPFDAFRAALTDGRAAPDAFAPPAQRGLKLFIGTGQCAVCHFGPSFTNREFHDIGVPYAVRPGLVDPGRHLGIRRLRESRYTLLGPFSDDPSRVAGTETRHVDLLHRNWGEFRVPSLRNLAHTAPYMHNGRLATLRDVVLHYSELNEERLHADGEKLLRPLKLSEAEIDDLVAFLLSLSAPLPHGETPPALPACRG